MAIKKIILIFSVYLSINSCTIRHEYNFYTRFDELNRKSTLFLTKDDIIIDSIQNIDSYYGKDSIVRRNNNQWDYYYNGRCGTGCSVLYYMNVSPVNDKIKVKLNILHKSKSNADYQNILTEEYIPYFSSGKNYISKIIKENGIVKNTTVNPVKYDRKNNIYYNTTFEYNNALYKGIKADSLEYIVLGRNNWKFYNSKSKEISDLK